MKQFSIGLTGLTTHQRALETSANNIANASTVGYKAGEYLFADQFSTFLSQTDAGKVGQGAMEIGVRRNFSQGSFRKTGSSLTLPSAAKASWSRARPVMARVRNS